LKDVDGTEGMVFIVEESRSFTVLMQELRFLKAFSAERSKHNLSLWLWEVAEDV